MRVGALGWNLELSISLYREAYSIIMHKDHKVQGGNSLTSNNGILLLELKLLDWPNPHIQPEDWNWNDWISRKPSFGNGRFGALTCFAYLVDLRRALRGSRSSEGGAVGVGELAGTAWRREVWMSSRSTSTMEPLSGPLYWRLAPNWSGAMVVA